MERPDYSQSNIALAIAAMEAELSHDDAQVPAPMRAAWTVIKGALEEARPLLRPPAADAPAGTLAAALAVLDRYLGQLEVEVNMGPANDAEAARDQAASQAIAAWATARAAAIKSLEPPAPAKPKGTPGQRARKFVATTLDAMHRISETPSPDASAAIGVQAAFAQVVLGGLLLEVLDDMSDDIGALARSIESANQTGWGGG